MTLVSIVIPNFNKERYIIETIESIISQTYKNWEVLIIDDGSTDSSISKAKEFTNSDLRFKYFERVKPPKGASHCRNIGLKNAKGKFLLFLDSDDLLSPFCLENRVKEFRRFNDNDFIVFPMGTFIRVVGDNKMVWEIPKSDHLEGFLKHNLPWAIPCPIWKTEFLRRIMGFDLNYSRLQDVELHTRALLDDNLIYKVSSSINVDCYYRVDDERKTTDLRTFYSNWINSVEKYVCNTESMLKKKGRSDFIWMLKGTIFRALNSLYLASSNNMIDRENELNMSKKLISLSIKIDGNIRVLNLYRVLYKMGFYKVKGFNFVFNMLYVRN